MPETRKPIRFAYVGCGFVAQTIHIPNFRSLANCRFMALAEPRQELGRSVAARFGIPKVYRSHEEIAADPEIEAVGVSAPYALQGRIAQDLIHAGKHVFMEKPMAISLPRAESIVAAVGSGTARLMVGYMKRYDAGNVLIKQHIDDWRQSGRMGQPVLARNHGFGGSDWVYANDPNVVFERSSEPAPPAPDEYPAWLPEARRESYIGYLQQWTHNVNLLRFFLGDTDGTVKVKSVELDKDGLTGIVVLEINGVRAVVESAYTAFHAWDEHTQIYFDKGWLKTHAPALMQKQAPATVEVYRSQSPEAPPQLIQEFPSPCWAYRQEAIHFLDCISSGAPFGSPAEDTLHDVRIFEEIYKSFLTQRAEL